MKILYLVKFYEPFDRGGSEWSTHDLAKLMVERGHEITILTPNYGAKSHQIKDGIEIRRFPFIKLKNPKDPIAPYWTNNIVWLIYTTLLCIHETIQKKFDIIHAHSNEFIPAAAIASKIRKVPSVVTFRDYQALCSLGFCLWGKNRVCDLSEFIRSDFPFFYNNYVVSKNPFKYLMLLTVAVRAKFTQKLIYYFAQKIDYKIAVSRKVANIFHTNGINDITRINNPVIIKSKISKKPNDEIVYIVKLSKGKGIELLFEILPKIIGEIPQAKFKIIGSGYLQEFLERKAKRLGAQKIAFLGQIDHIKSLAQIKKAALVIVPSIWPEPLPRSATETILSGTPVVATNVGGLAEIVKNNVYGILCKPEPFDLQQAIIRGFRTKETLRKNITKDLAKLKKHFTTDIVQSYEKIYHKAHS